MNTPSLRSAVLRGGVYVIIRQAVGTAINVVGVLLLTRAIGPGEYGVYATASGLFVAVQLVAQLGVGIFLIRTEREIEHETCWQASTLLLLLALGGLAVGIATLPLVVRWTRIPGIAPAALAVYAMLPLSNLAQVPLARLERALDYKKVAWTELASQTGFFAVALPLAFAGAGAWAAVSGFCAQQLLLFLLTHMAARYQPKLYWSRPIAREIVAYGSGYTASLWLYSLRRLVNPLVVGRYAGADAVGIVALATQIVTHLSFAATATARLSMAALARVQTSVEKLRRAISEGMRLQTLAVGPIVLVFGWLAPTVVPALLGKSWQNVALIYPYMGIWILANSVFNLESSALYVLRRNREMAIFHTVQTLLLVIAALLLVPRMGMIGYGFAELVALASYVVLHGYTARYIGALGFARNLALAAAFGAVILINAANVWSLAALALLAVLLRPWRDVAAVISDLRGMAYD
ncbi:MAG TPA: oligosaccharide flippase family protein [Longimicrobiales bacterium]